MQTLDFRSQSKCWEREMLPGLQKQFCFKRKGFNTPEATLKWGCLFSETYHEGWHRDTVRLVQVAPALPTSESMCRCTLMFLHTHKQLNAAQTHRGVGFVSSPFACHTLVFLLQGPFWEYTNTHSHTVMSHMEEILWPLLLDSYRLLKHTWLSLQLHCLQKE